MMNWSYHLVLIPRTDAGATELAREMGDIFLQGIGTASSQGHGEKPSATSR